tara:strand:- start:1502 stop:1765 length:264 start_codon:yes stop_codon:yes gene_type:complete
MLTEEKKVLDEILAARERKISSDIVQAVAMEHYHQGGLHAIEAIVESINKIDRDTNDRKIWSFNEFVVVLDILKQDWADAHKEMKNV